MSLVQFLTFGLEIKASKVANDKGRIEGYASTFGNIDQGLDVVDHGAFKATINATKGKWPVLADHNPTDHIGWNIEASEDSKGLAIVSEIDMNVQKGKEKYSLAKAALEIGAPMGISIGFTTIKAEPDPDNTRIRHLKELKMWEHSIVTFPMNTQAMVTAAKSIGAIDKAKFLLEQLKAQGVSVQDFEIALHQEAAKTDEDPTLISQSLDRLIEQFRK